MTQTYLFDSDSLYKVGGGLDPEPVQPMTLECYEVTHVGRNFLGGQNIQFKIKDRGDTLYESSYAWALVLNTPENLEAVKPRAKLRVARDKATKAAKVADAKVIKFA